jgi:hypothetical protein
MFAFAFAAFSLRLRHAHGQQRRFGEPLRTDGSNVISLIR